jgi:conjugative transposon TraJ protein
MHKKMIPAIILALLCLPMIAMAQSLPEQLHGMHDILADMKAKILPRCKVLLVYARVLASGGATFYIGYRVWKHIAAAEPIDFFPLFRPFVLLLCIGMFGTVTASLDLILSPVHAGTEELKLTSDKAIKTLLAKKQEALKSTKAYQMFGVKDGEGDRDVWMYHTHPADRGQEGLLEGIGYDVEFAMSKAYYNLKNSFKELIAFLLQLLYETAALCINTIATFNIIICVFIGPFVFALSCFDGFQHSLNVWFARYINYSLWVPVANILGGILGIIQEEMLQLDIAQVLQYGQTFFSASDIGYLIFMIIGIVSYFTIPSIASMIVNPGGGNALTAKMSHYTGGVVNSGTSMVVGGALGVAGGAAAGIGMTADVFGDAALKTSKGLSGHGAAGGYFNDKLKD